MNKQPVVKWRPWRRYLGLAGLAVAISLAAFVGVRTLEDDAQAATCTVDEKLVNSCRPWLAAAVSHYPMAGGSFDRAAQFSFFEKRLNNPEVLSTPSLPVTITNKLDFVHTYRAPGQVIGSWEKTMINRAGTYLQLNWKPTETTWAAADGRDATVNANIDLMANSVKSVAPKKVFLTVFHEPENDVTAGTGGTGCSPSNGSYGSPADYRAMWQNVRNRFDALGVSNVVWSMNYMGYVSYDCYVPQLWPGNHLVDWVTWDPYDGGTATYASSVSRFYNRLLSTSDATHDYNSKPWGLAEFGYWNQNGDSTPAEAVKYWQQAQASVETNQFPRLKMYSVFDSTPDGTYIDSAFVGLQFAQTAVIDKNEQAAYNGFANAVLKYGSDTTPPTVSVNAPDTFTGPVTLSATANDNVGVTKVEYLLDGSKIGEATTAPYDYVFDSTTRPDGSYSLTAKAYDAEGNVGTSTVKTITINNSETTAPTVSITSPADGATVSGTVTIAADAADNVGVTKVDFAHGSTAIGSSTTAPYSVDWDTTTVADGQYTLTATAYDAAGNSAPATITLTVDNPDTQAPTAPTGLTATATSHDRVDLSWSAATDDSGSIDKYQVFRDGSLLAETNGLSVDYADTTVAESTTYSYTVKAVDASGNISPASASASVTTPAPPDVTPPSAPTNLTATAVAFNRVDLTWTAATDNSGTISKYQVFRGGQILAETTGTSYSDTTVTESTIYLYSVKAVDPSGNVGPASDGASTTTPAAPDTTPPSAPANLAATATAYNRVNLTWSASSDNSGTVTKYYIYRGGAVIAETTGLTFADTTVNASTTYSYVVRALDPSGNVSAASNMATVTTPAAPDTTAPSAPTGLVATSISSRQVNLSWNAATDNVGVATYRVYRNGALIATVPAGTRTFGDGTVSPKTSYSYTIRATDAAGNISNASNTLNVTTKAGK
jgi:chitodextrinase